MSRKLLTRIEQGMKPFVLSLSKHERLQRLRQAQAERNGVFIRAGLVTRLAPSRCKASARPDESGFTYIGLLLLIVIMGVTLAIIDTLWHTTQQRAKEKQLLFVGSQFSHAINAYYQQTFNGVHQFPKSLEELLRDKRYPNTTRYLRRIFYDPFTGTTQWGLIRGADGGIVGVHSLSDAVPFKTGNFAKQYESFDNKSPVSEWRFTYNPNGQNSLAANLAIGQPISGNPAGGNPTSGNAGSGNPAPAVNVPPVSQVPPPLPPDPTADQRKQRLCQIMRNNDTGICAAVAARYGAAAGTVCSASAGQRYTICTSSDNAMLPPLTVLYK